MASLSLAPIFKKHAHGLKPVIVTMKQGEDTDGQGLSINFVLRFCW